MDSTIFGFIWFIEAKEQIVRSIGILNAIKNDENNTKQININAKKL